MTVPAAVKVPTVGRKRVYANAAEKRSAYLERNQLCQLNVTIHCDCMELLDEYIERQKKDGPALTKAQVIEKLIRAQLLRKR